MSATPPRKKLRWSFQAKVLAPVLAVLVLLPVLTLWIVNRYISRQMQDESRQTLVAAESVFQQLLEYRTRDLLSRFRNAVNESSYRSLASIAADPEPAARETIRVFLNERLEAYGDDCEALILTAKAGAVAARRGAGFEAEDFIRATADLTRLAMQGEAAHAPLTLHGHAYLAIVVPISQQEKGPAVGTLAVAVRIGDSALRELKAITGTDILLVDRGAVTASTLPQPALPAEVLQPPADRRDAARARPVQLEDEHYLALVGSYAPGGQGAGFRYVLLSSYEQRLRELERTRSTLLTVSVAGVILSAFIVWFLIRRITQPLLQLRDSAEAVGHGDFTRRIDRFSNDECGDLAEAFNQMTSNLQSSRVDLEKAVGTLKTTQAQLIQSEKLSAVGQFVAGIAHELNNPLTTVIGFADLLQHMDLDPQIKSHLDHIAKSATRCHKIVHSLLGFARQQEPERKLVRLNDVVDAVLEIVAYDMRTNNVAIVREYDPNLPQILADSHQLQQVILNILSNARQAIEAFRPDGQIVLRTGASETHVWLRIKDNGPGIRREALSRIFDPFYTTKPQGKGTGLGLSLSYGIIQEHQGSIRVESEPGEGAEFIIELPIARSAPVAAVRAPTNPGLPTGPSLKVLVVDDEPSILNLIQAILTNDGHGVDTAATGQAALELVQRHRYDVIISDWKMPGLNGMQIFEDLQRHDPATARRMLFMTGDVVNDIFQEFLKKHGRACLPKPFSVREFRAAIQSLNSGRPNGTNFS
jgi:signal transduction histidine kinase/ActR/RegA family two-component response regulator